MTNFKQSLAKNFFSKIAFFVFLIFSFSITFSQIANATVYSPGATLEPDCAPGSPSCGVSTPAITNIGNTNLTLTANRTLTLDGYTLTFEGASFDVVIDDSGNLSVGGGTISTPSSGLSLTANAGSAGTIQIGTGGAGSTTPDILTLDVKSDVGDPAGTNGSMYYNASTNKLRCYENSAWADCIFQSTGSAQNLTLARIGNSTFSTLQHLQNVFHSAGYTSGGAITDAGGETINIAAGTGLIRSSNTATATISYFDWVGQNGVAIPTNSIRYIGIEYNGGSPQISVRTSSNWNLKTDFPIGVIVNEGGSLTIFSDFQAVGDHAANMIQREYETMPIEPDVRNGGLVLNETGTRNITVSAGAVWDRLNRYTIPALNTNITGNFDAYYMDGSGGFTKVTGLTQWPNTQYDDTDGTLATMTDNYYSVLWFYLDTNATVSMIYGMDEYSTSGLAEAEMEPEIDMLPDRLKVFGKLLGKIIFQKGASTATNIESLISMSSSSSLITSHASLTDLDYASSGHTGFANAVAGVNNNITSSTSLASITPSSGLTITGSGASVWSTSSGALTLDSATALNLGTTNATALNLGKAGVTTTNNGNLSVIGDFITPRGTDYTTTGTQNDVNLGVGSYFHYAGNGLAIFTGIAGGSDGRLIRILNDSAFDLTLKNADVGSLAINRIETPNGQDLVIPPDMMVAIIYDSESFNWHLASQPATATTISGFAFVQNGNAFGSSAILGTTDTFALNLITSGATRFSVASGSSTLTGTGATSLVGGSTLALSSAAASALNITSGTTGALTLDSGSTGAINVGTNANAKTLTIGNTTGATAVNINSGSGNINFGGNTVVSGSNTFTTGTGTTTINSTAISLAGNSSVLDMTGTGTLGLNTTTNRAITTGTGLLTVGGDLVISGDDLFMSTNTSGALLVADGTNFNPVVLSGDATIASNGALTLNYAGGQSADISNKGFLTSADWNTFNNKQNALGFTAENIANKDTDVTLSANSDTKYPSQKAVKTYIDNVATGINWKQPVELINVIADVASPVGSPVHLDGYIINTGGNTGAWASFAAGDLVQYQTDTWVKIKSMAIGDRFGVAFRSETVASGSMTGKENYEVEITGGTSGAFTYTFTAPTNNSALFVQNVNAYYHNVSFVYSSTLVDWVQLSASTDFLFGNGTSLDGRTVSIGPLTADWAQTGVFDINTNGNININNSKALSVAGNTTLSGNFILPKGTDYTSVGNQNNVSFGIGTLFNFSGASDVTITGISGGVDGRFIRIINASSSNIILKYQDTNSLAANRIITETATDVTILPDSSFELSYDAGVSRWRVVVLPTNTALINGGNGYGSDISLGTTDAFALNLITSGATRFSLDSGASTLTGTGATSLVGGSTLALSSAAASTLNITSGTTGALTLDSGSTGAINVGTNANAKTLTIGNTTGATAVNINSGSGNINFGGNTVVSGSNTFTTGTGTTTINSTAISLAGNSSVLDMTGTGTLGLNTTTNRAITTGTGLLTVGGSASVNGNLTASGNFITPKGSDYSTTGTQNDVDLGTGSVFNYTGVGTATFTGFAGGVDGRQVRIVNNSSSSITLNHQDTGSVAANRFLIGSGIPISLSQNSSVTLLYDSSISRWRLVQIPASSAIIGAFAFLQNGNAYGTTATLGTTDANGLNFITSGATRFGIAAGSATLTGTGSTSITSTGSTALDATTSLSLGTSTATSIAIGQTGVATTNNGSFTSTQTLTASNGLTLTTGALNLTATSGTLTLGSTTLAGASPLVFDGVTADANKTTFAITDPTAAHTVTFPNATITVNAAANISGTTLASNVVTSSLTATGALSSGSIASGFGSIATTNNITTSANISSTGSGTVTSAGTLTASNGLTLTTGALNLTATSGALALSGLSASSMNYGANNVTFTSGNFNTTATGINSTAIGATTASTGAFSTLSSTGATNIATSGASNVTIATTGTGNVAIGNATGTLSLASSGGLNVTTGGALTGVASIDTIATSATALTFAGAGTISSTTSSSITLDSGSTGAINIGTGSNAKTITIGNTTGATALVLNSGSGNITLGAQMITNGAGIEFTESDTNPTCASGNYNIYADTSEGKLKKCVNGVASDLQAIPDLNSFTDSTLSAAWTDANTNELWDDTTRPNITPKSTASEILVMVTIRGSVATSGGGDTNNPVARIDREIGVTADCADTNNVGPTIGEAYLEAGVAEPFTISTIFVDTPSTTSNVSYTVCSSSDSGGISDTTTATRTEVTLFEVNDAADLAEIYSTNDNSISMGDVVSLDPLLQTGVKKSEGINDKKVLGIVSSKPAMVIGGTNAEGSSAVPVALSGRVPVKVVTENGAIVAGDYLTSSSTPGVAMKSNGTGAVIGQAMSAFDSDGIGIVTVFVKNFDLGEIGETALLLGDISPKVNLDGTDNGLSTLVATIQSEDVRDPVIIIGKKISDGKEFLMDFVSARITAIRGYFDEIFTKKVHTEEICVKKSDGNEICVNGDQINTLLNNANINPIPTTPAPASPAEGGEPSPAPAPEITPEPSPTPESQPEDGQPSVETSANPAEGGEVTSEPVPEPTPAPAPEITPEPSPAPTPDPAPAQ